MMNLDFKRLLPLVLLVLSFPLLIGIAAKDVLGVGCGGCGGPPPPAEETPPDTSGQLPGGGGVAASLTYSLDRSDIGKSYEGPTSEKGTYLINATLGNYLSQGRVLSDKYMVHHPMGREVISAASALKAKKNKESDLDPGAEPAEPAEPDPDLEDQSAEEEPLE